jgi:hypothetical protein
VSEAPRRGFLARLRGWRGSKPARPAVDPAPAERAPAEPAPEPARAPAPASLAAVAPPDVDPDPGPDPAAPPEVDPDAVLVAVLDRLGSAHHRPFSRS